MSTSVLLIGGCGYIGSRLYRHLKRKGFAVDTLDLEWRGNFVNSDNIKMHCAEASETFFKRYDVIFWLAGHSSVAAAHADPQGAVENNISTLFTLHRKLSPSQLLCYASSASVYHGGLPDADEDSPAGIGADNAYDISKACFDDLMIRYGEHFVCMRFGTLAGASDNLRPELIVNAMSLSAIHTGIVRVSNSVNRRSILGLSDFVRVAEKLIERGPGQREIYNLASFTATIGEVGESVAHHFGVRTEKMPPSRSYDYSISTKKFREAFDFSFHDTIESLAEELATHEDHEKGGAKHVLA